MQGKWTAGSFVAIAALGLITMASCKSKEKAEIISRAKQEILKTEIDFKNAVKEEGMAAAFTRYAAEDAVILRDDSLVIGRQAIKDGYEKSSSANAQLIWTADFVDVSASGDLGYTYGNYTYSVTDSIGNTTDYKGIFHTIWKKQPDGTWRFVWD